MNDADRELLTDVGAKLDKLRRVLRQHAKSYHEIRKLQEELNDDYFDLVVRVTGEDPTELKHVPNSPGVAFKKGNEYGRITKGETEAEGEERQVSNQRPPRFRTEKGQFTVRSTVSRVQGNGDSTPHADG